MAHEDSALTVESLLGEPVLRGRLLGGVAGLGARVSWCLPWSEVARPTTTGGTGGSAGTGGPVGGDLEGVAVHVPAAQVATAEQARVVVEGLARRGAAVVLVWPAAGGEVDLGYAVRAAERVGVPLVGLPPEADYRSIGRLVAVKSISGAAHVLEYSVRVHRTLGEVFATGSGLATLAGAMSALAGSTVLVMDRDGDVLARGDQRGAVVAGSWEELAAEVHRRVGAEQAAPGPDGSRRHDPACDFVLDGVWGDRTRVVVCAVRVAGERYGTVVVVQSEGADAHDLAQHRVIVEQGATLVASEMLRQRSVTEAEERARDDFLDVLVHGRFSDVHQLTARSRHYGFDAGARHVVFVVEVPGVDAVRALRLVRHAGVVGGSSVRGFVMAGCVGQVLVVVREVASGSGGARSSSPARVDASGEQAEVRRFGEELARVVGARADGAVQVAYGRGAGGAAGVARSYREARVALELSRQVGVPRVCGYEELRVFAAISDMAATAQGRAFSREMLEPLGRRDGQTGDLLDVVLAYIAASGNLNQAARQLGLHRNTMLYKLERASRALGRDIRTAEVQFMVWLAHHIDVLNAAVRRLDVEVSPLT